MLLLSGARFEATDCAFVRNRALIGSGGAIAARGASLSLARVLFEANEASWRGGALSLTSTNTSVADADVLDGVGHASAMMREVTFNGNTANRGADDVSLVGGAELAPRPRPTDAAVEAAPAGAEGIATGPNGTFGSGALSELPHIHRLTLSSGSMAALECASEALEVLEIRGFEPLATPLLASASRADPFSSSVFSFYFNFLYTHAMDQTAATLLAAFRHAVPDHSSLPSIDAIIANKSAPTLHKRGQTLNGQVARMREGVPTAILQTTRAAAQDAAVEAYVQAAALAPTDGEIWNDLGTSLFFAAELSESISAYAFGLKHAPNHPALRKESARESAFPPAPIASDAIATELRGRLDSAFDAVALPEGSYGGQPSSLDLQGDMAFVTAAFGSAPSIFVSKEPLIPKAVCATYVQAAEAWGAKHGGWTTSRHYSVATTDVPLIDLPDLLPSFNKALHAALLPALAAVYPRAAPLVSRLHVLDCFLVRYDAAAQASLPTHTDQSLLSFTISLNDPSEYEGGGTYFKGIDRAVDAPAAGHAVLFPGKVEHGGHPITAGRRYLVHAHCLLSPELS